MTASDCYYFRCSLLHQGSTEHDNSAFKKIMFIEPPHSYFHNVILEDVLIIDVSRFCIDMVDGGVRWYHKHKENETFKRNYEKTFKRYPYGFPPYVSGIPLFA